MQSVDSPVIFSSGSIIEVLSQYESGGNMNKSHWTLFLIHFFKRLENFNLLLYFKLIPTWAD